MLKRDSTLEMNGVPICWLKILISGEIKVQKKNNKYVDSND